MAASDRTRRTPKKAGEWRPRFLTELAETCNVSAACEIVGVGRSTAYDARDSDEAFAAEWDSAIEQGVDALELEARRRAASGVEKPVFYKGEQVAVVREYSDVLLIFLLKAHRPEKYRDLSEVKHSGNVGLTLTRIGEILRED